MADTLDPRINDQYTGVQLRLIRQKLDEKRDRAFSRSTNSDDEDLSLSPRARLRQSMLKRQELLDRIKNEDRLAGQLHRPSSGRMHRSHDYRAPPSRLSLPENTERRQPPPRDGSREHYYYVYNEPREHSYPKHILEHQVKPMPTRLDPLPYSPRMQPISQPPAQFMTVPQPYIINNGPAEAPRVAANPSSTKQDMMEMMMMQNAQTHQMMMSQMMMSSLPQHNKQNTGFSVEDLLLLKEQRKPPEVHHHHYDPNTQAKYSNQRLPPIQTQAPPINIYPSNRNYPTEVAPLRQPVFSYEPSQLQEFYSEHNNELM